jgi:DNA-binding MarR family transcriptional regulator
MEAKHVLVSEIADYVHQMFQILNEVSKRVEQQTGLTSPQLWAIKILVNHAPLRVTDLARRMYLHPATVVGILHRLESRGFIEKSVSKDDRRAMIVTLTEEGKRLFAAAPEVVQGHLVSGLERLPMTELTAMKRVLKKITAALSAQKMPSCSNLPVKRDAGKKERPFQ